jgi:hypothetical protein
VRVSGPGDALGAIGIEAREVDLSGVAISGTGSVGLTVREGTITASDLRTDRVATGIDLQDDTLVLVAGSRIVARDAGLETRGNAVALAGYTPDTKVCAQRACSCGVWSPYTFDLR